jgi:AhpD family alkylhydroperoxidase
MGDYENSLNEIKKTMGLVLNQFKSIPPDTLPHEWQEMKEYSFGETKIPAKYRELIGLAIAASIKCPYYVYFHTKAAKMNGATDEELAELAFLTRFTTGWSSILHASGIDFEAFKKQFDKAEECMTTKAKP